VIVIRKKKLTANRKQRYLPRMSPSPFSQKAKVLINSIEIKGVEPLHFSHHYTVWLVQWVNRLLPTLGVSGSCPGGAPTFLELGSSVSDVLLHWWPRRDPWSPAMIGPLCSLFSWWPEPSALAPFLSNSSVTAGYWLWWYTARILEGIYPLLGALIFLTPLPSLTGPVGQPSRGAAVLPA
jgi:hypothetical protein